MSNFIPISYVDCKIQIVSSEKIFSFHFNLFFLLPNCFYCKISDSHALTPAQNEFIKETEIKVYRLLEETPPNGKKFSQTVRHMLKREELWNSWKNEGCKGWSKQNFLNFSTAK